MRPCFDIVAQLEKPILERMTPLEKEMIVERSNTFASPASWTSVTQIVKVNTGDICPTLHKDLDLLKQVLEQNDENNSPSKPLISWHTIPVSRVILIPLLNEVIFLDWTWSQFFSDLDGL